MWKPYLILRQLEKMEYGDYLMYADAGTIYVRSIKHLIRAMSKYQQDILPSSSCFKEWQWSKRDAFEIIGCNYEKYRDSFQYEATFILLKKTDRIMEFVKEWVSFSADRRVNTDDDNVCGIDNEAGFICNRHDQTAYSLLCKKYGFIGFKSISDSSELYKFLRYNDGEFFGMSRNELLQNAKEHHFSEEYNRGEYPRIMINTRLANSGRFLFVKRLVKKTIINLRNDIRGKKEEIQYLNDK